jgi:hypothetical protein
MSNFKIAFMDGKEMEVEAANFSVAFVLAAYSRVVCGDKQTKQLMINQKKCFVLKTRP